MVHHFILLRVLPTKRITLKLELYIQIRKMTDSSTLLFSKNWTIYQKIIRTNFMLHNEFGSITKRILDNIDCNRSITLLDLGCGDTSHLAYHLTGLQLSLYTGYDMSSCARN